MYGHGGHLGHVTLIIYKLQRCHLSQLLLNCIQSGGGDAVTIICGFDLGCTQCYMEEKIFQAIISSLTNLFRFP